MASRNDAPTGVEPDRRDALVAELVHLRSVVNAADAR